MHRRLGRAGIIALLLATLLVPSVTSGADSQSELEQIRAERAALLERIERHEAKAATLEEEVDALNAGMIELRAELMKIDRQIADIEAQVRSAQARIDATQAKMDRIYGLATEQAELLYKNGTTDTIGALLTAKSLAELDARVELLGVAAAENTGALIQYGRLKATVEAHHRDLFQRKRVLAETQESKGAILASLDSQHEKLASKLAELEQRLDEEHEHEGNLMVAEARLRGDIQAAQALESVKDLGTSSQGFIWPLNGAITSYYGPRWGRMHTGIDIDGVSGQAVVASKAGHVILSQYYSGYGNAVIVDHGGGIATLYAHLSAFDVSAGQDVSQGTVVGRVGCTGSCTGDHLHFEVRVNGSPVDPLDFLP